MGLSIWQILIIAVVILVLFGRGRISEMMGDFGKGISSFKKCMAEEDGKPSPSAQIEAPTKDGVTIDAAKSEKSETPN